MRKKREMYMYTTTEAKELCWKLLNSFTNVEDMKDPVTGYKEDFDKWFEQNKKKL